MYTGTHAERKAYWEKKQTQRDERTTQIMVNLILFCFGLYLAMIVATVAVVIGAVYLVVLAVKFIYKKYQLYKDQH